MAPKGDIARRTMSVCTQQCMAVFWVRKRYTTCDMWMLIYRWNYANRSCMNMLDWHIYYGEVHDIRRNNVCHILMYVVSCGEVSLDVLHRRLIVSWNVGMVVDARWRVEYYIASICCLFFVGKLNVSINWRPYTTRAWGPWIHSVHHAWCGMHQWWRGCPRAMWMRKTVGWTVDWWRSCLDKLRDQSSQRSHHAVWGLWCSIYSCCMSWSTCG